MSEMSAGSVPRKEPGTGKVLGSRDRVTLGTLGGGGKKTDPIKNNEGLKNIHSGYVFF